MDRIEPGSFFGVRDDDRRRRKKLSEGESSESFSRVLGANDGKASRPVDPASRSGFRSDRDSTNSARAEELLDEIHVLGEELVRANTLTNLDRYREAVRSFLRVVVGEGLELQEAESGANVLNRKRFTTIAVVDQKLERLAAALLATQSEPLNLLARVQEIEGLLVDMLH